MKSFAMVSAGGVLGLIVLKVFFTFVLPAMAVMFGLMMMALKIGLIALVGYFVFKMFRRCVRPTAEA